ncbi:MAG: hypothetical protein ACLVHM_09330, partial [Collinsella sp.]
GKCRLYAAVFVDLDVTEYTNYVYLVDAADDRGNVRELQLIFFGRESDGEGWLGIEARGGSGVRYRACEAAEAPAAARRALDR